jgi:hypothetical protein
MRFKFLIFSIIKIAIRMFNFKLKVNVRIELSRIPLTQG